MPDHCICQGQCGRHEGQCPERSDQYSKLWLAFGRYQTACLPAIRQRSDGQFWCSICWRIKKARLRTERRNRAARQRRLFDG